MSKLPLIPTGSGFFPAASRPHCPLAATLRFGHDRQFPTTEGEGRRSLLAEYGHRRAESCEGDLKHHTSQGGFWLRRHPPHHDPGKLPSLLRRDVTGSHTARILWLTKRTTSSSGCPALIFVEPLNEEWMERN